MDFNDCYEYMADFLYSQDFSSVGNDFTALMYLTGKENGYIYFSYKNGEKKVEPVKHELVNIYVAMSIENFEKIINYSKLMLGISSKLEKALQRNGFPVIRKDYRKTPTQHIWSRFNNQNECYRVFIDLEKLGIYTNYRLLPYSIGYGLRLGVGAAIQSGLRAEHVETLANIMTRCYKDGYSDTLYNESQELIRHMSVIGKYL